MSIDRTIDTLAARRAGLPKTTGSLEPIKGRCCVKLTFTGTGPDNPPRYCMNWPLKGKRHCKTKCHSGKSATGIASHLYRNGMHTTTIAMPSRIAADYEVLLQDDQLLSLKKEIALQRAYYRDLQARTEDGALLAPATFKAIQKVLNAWKAVGLARQGKSKAILLAAMTALQDAMTALDTSRQPAVIETASREELRETWRVLEKLTSAENRRVESLYNMITAERAFALRHAETTVFLEAITTYVTDPAIQTAIRRHVQTGFERLARRRDPAEMDARRGSGGEQSIDSAAADR